MFGKDMLPLQGLAAVAAAYVLYICATCPCRPNLYSCHLTQLYAALGVILAIIVYYNGFQIISY